MIYTMLNTHWTLATLFGLIAGFISVMIAITIHEYAHARSANAYGDGTAKGQGRMTLNPLAHYDPIGSTLFLLFGFGWAKPVPVNPYRMRDPRWDGLRCALWGPFSNILVAIGLGGVLRFVPEMPVLPAAVITLAVYLNLWLAFFNLIPLPPLDGSRIITSLLPPDVANRFERFAHQWGLLIVLLIAFMFRGLLFNLIGLPAYATMALVTGKSIPALDALLGIFW